MRHQTPSNVGETLRRVLQRIDPDKRLQAFDIWNFWDEEVGDAIARHAQPAGFRAGVLSVRVDGAAWMQELQFLKEGLRERLNRRLGDPLIRDIYFVSGAIQRKPTAAGSTGDDRLASVPVAMPRLNDPKLAEIFQRIARAYARRPR